MTDEVDAFGVPLATPEQPQSQSEIRPVKWLGYSGIFLIILLVVMALTNSRPYFQDPLDASLFNGAVRIILTIWVTRVAKSKGLDTLGWGFITFLLPFVGMIVVGFAPDKRKKKSRIIAAAADLSEASNKIALASMISRKRVGTQIKTIYTITLLLIITGLIILIGSANLDANEFTWIWENRIWITIVSTCILIPCLVLLVNILKRAFPRKLEILRSKARNFFDAVVNTSRIEQLDRGRKLAFSLIIGSCIAFITASMSKETNYYMLYSAESVPARIAYNEYTSTPTDDYMSKYEEQSYNYTYILLSFIIGACITYVLLDMIVAAKKMPQSRP